MSDPFKKLMRNVELSSKYGQGGGRARKLLEAVEDSGKFKDKYCSAYFGGGENREIDITVSYLRQVFYAQKGRCAALGTKLNLQDLFVSNHPLAPSVDRIDNTKGYVRGNIVITSRFANKGRGNAEYDFWINEIVPKIKEGFINED